MPVGRRQRPLRVGACRFLSTGHGRWKRVLRIYDDSETRDAAG